MYCSKAEGREQGWVTRLFCCQQDVLLSQKKNVRLGRKSKHDASIYLVYHNKFRMHKAVDSQKQHGLQIHGQNEASQYLVLWRTECGKTCCKNCSSISGGWPADRNTAPSWPPNEKTGYFMGLGGESASDTGAATLYSKNGTVGCRQKPKWLKVADVSTKILQLTLSSLSEGSKDLEIWEYRLYFLFKWHEKRQFTLNPGSAHTAPDLTVMSMSFYVQHKEIRMLKKKEYLICFVHSFHVR